MKIKEIKKILKKKRRKFIKKYLKNPYKYNWYALLMAAIYFWEKKYQKEN